MGTVSFCWKEHGEFLLKSIADLLDEKCLLDANVTYGNACLRVHRLILAAFLPTFRNSLEVTNEAEQPLMDLTLDYLADDVEDVTALIRFMYTGTLTVSENRVEHLRRLAEVLCFQGLADALATKGHFNRNDRSAVDLTAPVIDRSEQVEVLLNPVMIIKEELGSDSDVDDDDDDDDDDDAASCSDHVGVSVGHGCGPDVHLDVEPHDGQHELKQRLMDFGKTEWTSQWNSVSEDKLARAGRSFSESEGENLDVHRKTSSLDSMDTSHMSEVQKRRLRRKRPAPEEWKQNVLKMKRMMGERYSSKRRVQTDGGKLEVSRADRSERVMGSRCDSKQCSRLLSCNEFQESDRREIFEDFWKKFTWTEKKLFVTSLVDTVAPTKRNKMTSLCRQNTMIYHLKLGEERKHVCRQMFVATLGISRSQVHRWVTEGKASHDACQEESGGGQSSSEPSEKLGT